MPHPRAMESWIQSESNRRGDWRSQIDDSREFKRNLVFVRTRLGIWQYKPDYAQYYADERRKAKRHYYKFTDEVAEFVREKLLEDWSPEQVSGYAKR